MSTKLLSEHLKNLSKCIHNETNKVRLLNSSLVIDSDQIKLNSEQSNFNDWLNNDGEYIHQHLHGSFFNDIKLLHDSWHDIYTKVYKLLYEDNRGFFSNKHLPKDLNSQEQTKLGFYYDDLKEISITLQHKIEILNLRISSSQEMDDDDINDLSLLGA